MVLVDILEFLLELQKPGKPGIRLDKDLAQEIGVEAIRRFGVGGFEGVENPGDRPASADFPG